MRRGTRMMEFSISITTTSKHIDGMTVRVMVTMDDGDKAVSVSWAVSRPDNAHHQGSIYQGLAVHTILSLRRSPSRTQQESIHERCGRIKVGPNARESIILSRGLIDGILSAWRDMRRYCGANWPTRKTEAIACGHRTDSDRL